MSPPYQTPAGVSPSSETLASVSPSSEIHTPQQENRRCPPDDSSKCHTRAETYELYAADAVAGVTPSGPTETHDDVPGPSPPRRQNSSLQATQSQQQVQHPAGVIHQPQQDASQHPAPNPLTGHGARNLGGSDFISGMTNSTGCPSTNSSLPYEHAIMGMEVAPPVLQQAQGQVFNMGATAKVTKDSRGRILAPCGFLART